MNENIGKYIKKIRTDNKLTQKEFADKLNVTYQAVSKWENGKNIPDISILKEISILFNVDLNMMLTGKKKKKKYFIYITTSLLLILLLIGYMLFNNKKNEYEFKKVTTTCDDFKIIGSAAYNKEKSSIYISNIEYCGNETDINYDSIDCILLEKHNNKEKEISTCESIKNISLTKYLENISINVDNYICKEFANSLIYLKINATKKNKKTTYTIPLKFINVC